MNTVHFLTAGKLVAVDAWVHTRRTLPHHVLILMLSGVFHMQVEQELYSLTAGDCLLLPADKVHRGWQEDRNLSYCWTHFESDGFPEGLPVFFHPVDSCSAVNLFNQLLHFSNRPSPDPLLLDLTLQTLLQELRCQTGEGAPASRSHEKDILEWIRAHLSQPINLTDVAREFHYSPKYFSELFSQTAGMGFSRYLRQQRLNKACALLVKDNRPISQIAAECGFRDEKYFMKVFRESFGRTAGEYRLSLADIHINGR